MMLLASVESPFFIDLAWPSRVRQRLPPERDGEDSELQ